LNSDKLKGGGRWRLSQDDQEEGAQGAELRYNRELKGMKELKEFDNVMRME